jgi:GT2 family glycosyltransferase
MEPRDLGEMTREPRPYTVTVAVPCYNSQHLLPDLVAAILGQTLMPEEILIVDDGSEDHTIAVARRYNVRVIEHGENKGLACARNTALMAAAGEVIVYFDADTLPGRRCLEYMLAAYGDPEIAGVGGQELLAPASRKIDQWRNLFWRQTHGPERCDPIWMLMGLCCSYRKSALVEVGGFSEGYRTNGEDVDMGLRMTKAGYRLVYLPEAGVCHRRSDTLRSLISLVFRHSFWQSRALRRNGCDPWPQNRKALMWTIVSMGSSLMTHRDGALALIGPIACLSGVAGRLWERASWKKSAQAPVPPPGPRVSQRVSPSGRACHGKGSGRPDIASPPSDGG